MDGTLALTGTRTKPGKRGRCNSGSLGVSAGEGEHEGGRRKGMRLYCEEERRDRDDTVKRKGQKGLYWQGERKDRRSFICEVRKALKITVERYIA